LDADALNTIALEPARQAALRARTRRRGATVLTPHPLEAARLLGCAAASVQAHRLDAAHRLAEVTGAIVVLKGSGTVIAVPGGECFINPTGNAALAGPGTGDVLAGWLAGRWARHPVEGEAADSKTSAQPGDTDQARAAAQLAALAAGAVFEHGAAADRHRAAGRRGPLRASDLIDALASG
jgi:ADP-dependent NAD(P)H-hydrate dehydratase / NAD(P)H-hydrate epimerase